VVAVGAAIQALKEALKGDDIDAIRSRTEALTAASEQIGRRLYEQASSSPDDDEVVDAEIVDDRMSA
jgi:molecular chaperone DnaK